MLAVMGMCVAAALSTGLVRRYFMVEGLRSWGWAAQPAKRCDGQVSITTLAGNDA